MKRVTPVLVVCSLGLIILIPMALYYLFVESEDKISVPVAIGAITCLAIFMVLVIERAIVNRLRTPLRKIWLVEFILIAVAVFGYLLVDAKFYFRVSDDVQWFVVMYTGGETSEKIKNGFPNNKSIRIEKNKLLLLNRRDMAGRRTIVRGTERMWNSYESNTVTKSINDEIITYEIYAGDRYKLTNSDSIAVSALLMNRRNLHTGQGNIK